MEDILVERFSWAQIETYKDYCNINDKVRLKRVFNDDLDLYVEEDEDGWVIKPSIKKEDLSKRTSNKFKGKIISLPQKKHKKQKTHYAYTTEDVQENFPIEYVYKNPKGFDVFHTQNARHIIRHYARPLSSICIFTLERSIRRHGNKVTIKYYYGVKRRPLNCIYFIKSFFVNSITIDFSSGNFTTLEISKNGRYTSKTFRCNSFHFLYKLLLNPKFNVFNLNLVYSSDDTLYNSFLNSFDNDKFAKTVKETLGIDNHDTNYSNDPMDFIEDFTKVFTKLKQIKAPDNSLVYLLTMFYPTEKFLKKNDRKLIASILDFFGVKSKLTIKILHEYPNIDLESFIIFCLYFGDDFTKYIGNLKPEVFKNSHHLNNFMHHVPKTYKGGFNLGNYHLSNTEKENLIHIMNNSNPQNLSINTGGIQLLNDHFNMRDRIREVDPSFSIKSKTLKEFNEEHLEYVKIISAINKGWVIEYIYDEKTLNEIEKPLECLYDDDTLHILYPTILKREEEYVEEGQTMHHCVASYTNKDKSMIISLRTEDNKDRVTCEFDIQTGRCIQKRHFCNQHPPKHFENGLEILEGTIIKLARWGLLNWKEKKKVPIKINGVEIPEKIIVRNATDIFGIELPF